MTPEECERRHIRTCSRCGRRAAKPAEWPDGPICRTCHERAMRVRGYCPACETDRLLPGRDPDGVPICRDRAGITRDFFCDRCNFEGMLLGQRLCERCTLSDRLTDLLDDGTGQTYPPLTPLMTLLLELDRPKSRLIWLRRPNVVQLLQDLARARVPLTHESLQQQEHWRTVAHLRDLLMESNVLPPADRRLLFYERWLAERLAAVEDPARHQLLHRFATWHQLRHLRAKADAGPLGPSPTAEARQQITHADAFLTWLAARDLTLDRCRQADLDAWHTDHYATRRPAQPFLRWSMDNGAMPRLVLPPHVIKQDQAAASVASPSSMPSSTSPTRSSPCTA